MHAIYNPIAQLSGLGYSRDGTAITSWKKVPGIIHEVAWIAGVAILLLVNLVPRPSHRPVLITCSMQKRRGKAWSTLLCEWRFVYLESERSPHWINELEALSCSFCSKFWTLTKQKTYLSCPKTKNACTKCIVTIGDPSTRSGEQGYYSITVSMKPSSLRRFIFCLHK